MLLFSKGTLASEEGLKEHVFTEDGENGAFWLGFLKDAGAWLRTTTCQLLEVSPESSRTLEAVFSGCPLLVSVVFYLPFVFRVCIY